MRRGLLLVGVLGASGMACASEDAHKPSRLLDDLVAAVCEPFSQCCESASLAFDGGACKQSVSVPYRAWLQDHAADLFHPEAIAACTDAIRTWFAQCRAKAVTNVDFADLPILPVACDAIFQRLDPCEQGRP